MALLFIDSPNYCSSGQESRVYNSGGFGRGGVGSGRSGIYAFTGFAGKTLSNEVLEVTSGVAWATPTVTDGGTIIQFGNVLTGFFFGLIPVGDGRLFVSATLRGATAISDPSSFTYLPSQWVYLEVSCTASPAFTAPDPPTIPEGFIYVSCNYTVRINEQIILSGIINTPAYFTNDGDLSHLNFIDIQWSGTFDDLYVTDGEFLGNVSMVPVYPATDVLTGWTASGGGDHFGMVNDHPAADDDVTYVSAGTTGLQDAYTFTAIPPFTGEIKGTQLMWLARQTDSGTAAFVGQYNEGAYQTEPFYTNETYQYLIDTQRINPMTGTDWTQGDLSSLIGGQQRTA